MLDLDNTLIFSAQKSLHVRSRQFLNYLCKLAKHPDIYIVVWSAGMKDYVDSVVNVLKKLYGLPVHLVLSREECHKSVLQHRIAGFQRHMEHRKPAAYILERLQLDPKFSFCVIIDDKLENSLSGYKLRIWIEPYTVLKERARLWRQTDGELLRYAHIHVGGEGEIAVERSLATCIRLINRKYIEWQKS